jgi:four helix bundle protein
MKKNLIEEKSFDFAQKIVLTYKDLVYVKKEFVLSKQLLRSGTSVGANVSEAVFGQSDKDFVSKLKIARKEANESLFWIRLMEKTDFLEIKTSSILKKDATELVRILTAIIKSTLDRMNNSES